MNKICSGELKKHQVEITYKGKSAGLVNIEFDFMSNLSKQVGNKLVAGLNLTPEMKK